MVSETSITGQLLKNLDGMRQRYEPLGIHPNLLEKIRRIVMIYLFVPLMTIAGSAVTVVPDFGRETFTWLRGNQTCGEWYTNIVTLTIFVVSLPFLLIGYYLGKRGILFPVASEVSHPAAQPNRIVRPEPASRIADPKPDPAAGRSQPGPALLSNDAFIKSVYSHTLQNDPTPLLLSLLDAPREPGCNLKSIMTFAVKIKNKDLVNKLVEQGQSINQVCSQHAISKAPLEIVLEEAEASQLRETFLDFAAFLVDEKGASLDNPKIWKIATKPNQDIDIIRFLCKRGLRPNGKKGPLEYSGFEALKDLYLRLEDPALLLDLLKLPCTFDLGSFTSMSMLEDILQFAIRTKNGDLVRELLARGCELDSTIKDDHGNSIMLIDQILNKTSDETPSEVTRRDWLNFSKEVLVGYFRSNPNKSSGFGFGHVRRLLNRDKIFQKIIELYLLVGDRVFLLNLLDDPHLSEDHYPIITSLAMQTRNRQLVEKLVEKGRSVNAEFPVFDLAKHNPRPVEFIIHKVGMDKWRERKEWGDFTAFLISKGAVYKEALADAIRTAVNSDRLEESLEFLLGVPVDLNIYFPDGHTPLTLAISSIGNNAWSVVTKCNAQGKLDFNLPCQHPDYKDKTALEIARELRMTNPFLLHLLKGKKEPQPVA